MTSVEQCIVIDKPVEEVFSYASDWQYWHEWFEGVSTFTPTTSIQKGSGTRYAYKANVMGIKVPVEIEIHDYVENEGWKGISTKGTPHRTYWRFEASGNQTRFTYGLESHLPIPVLGKFLDHYILQPQWNRIISNSLINLQKVFETQKNHSHEKQYDN